MPPLAPVLSSASGIPTEMVVKLFHFLQPDIDVEQMFAQFMANPVTPQQPEETLPKTHEMEDVATGVTSEELMAGAITTEEQGREEEARVKEDEVLAVAEAQKEERLEDEPEKTEARRATQPTTEEASEPLGQADLQERVTRKRRYHKIVVELSEEEEDENERPQFPVTKRSQTGMQAPQEATVKKKGVAPRGELPQPPPSMKKKGKKPEETPVKTLMGLRGDQVVRKSRPLTLGRNRVLRDESEEETETQRGSRIQPEEVGRDEGAQEGYGSTNYRKISIKINGENSRSSRCSRTPKWKKNVPEE